MVSKQGDFIFVYRLGKKSLPITDQFKKRGSINKAVIFPRQVGGGAGPWVGPGLFYHAGLYRVHFDVSGSREKVIFIQNKGCESALPQVTPPFLAKVNLTGISAMSLSQRPPQPVFRFRNNYEVHMVRHKTPGPNRNVTFQTPFTE